MKVTSIAISLALLSFVSIITADLDAILTSLVSEESIATASGPQFLMTGEDIGKEFPLKIFGVFKVTLSSYAATVRSASDVRSDINDPLDVAEKSVVCVPSLTEVETPPTDRDQGRFNKKCKVGTLTSEMISNNVSTIKLVDGYGFDGVLAIVGDYFSIVAAGFDTGEEISKVAAIVINGNDSLARILDPSGMAVKALREDSALGLLKMTNMRTAVRFTSTVTDKKDDMRIPVNAKGVQEIVDDCLGIAAVDLIDTISWREDRDGLKDYDQAATVERKDCALAFSCACWYVFA